MCVCVYAYLYIHILYMFTSNEVTMGRDEPRLHVCIRYVCAYCTDKKIMCRLRSGSIMSLIDS